MITKKFTIRKRYVLNGHNCAIICKFFIRDEPSECYDLSVNSINFVDRESAPERAGTFPYELVFLVIYENDSRNRLSIAAS